MDMPQTEQPINYTNLYQEITQALSHLPQGEYSPEASDLIKTLTQKYAQGF